MSIEQIAAEALRLPPRERALLAESLWDSLGDTDRAPGQMDDASALALAKERDQAVDSGKVRALSHEELMARVRK